MVLTLSNYDSQYYYIVLPTCHVHFRHLINSWCLYNPAFPIILFPSKVKELITMSGQLIRIVGTHFSWTEPFCNYYFIIILYPSPRPMGELSLVNANLMYSIVRWMFTSSWYMWGCVCCCCGKVVSSWQRLVRTCTLVLWGGRWAIVVPVWARLLVGLCAAKLRKKNR